MWLYILPTIFITLFSAAVLAFTSLYTAPKDQDSNLIFINLIYFFSAFFLSLAGLITLVLYSVSQLRSEKSARNIEKIHQPKMVFRRSLRHGFLISAVLVGIGLLNSLELANPLNIILLISAFLLIEIYFFGH